jgi:hypothetical protein
MFLLPLHIKLGLMEDLVKGMDQRGPAFRHLAKEFPGISVPKTKEDCLFIVNLQYISIDTTI